MPSLHEIAFRGVPNLMTGGKCLWFGWGNMVFGSSVYHLHPSICQKFHQKKKTYHSEKWDFHEMSWALGHIFLLRFKGVNEVSPASPTKFVPSSQRKPSTLRFDLHFRRLTWLRWWKVESVFFCWIQDSLHNDPNNISLCLTLAFSDTVKQGRSIWAKRLCVLDGSQKNREKWKEEV